jgi:hypothetical protein
VPTNSFVESVPKTPKAVAASNIREHLTMANMMEPSYDGEIDMVYVPKYRCHLSAGTFFLLKDDFHAVWRIVNVSRSELEFAANKFKIINFHRGSEEGPLANKPAIVHELARYIPEIVRTSDTHRCLPTDVRDIAFVYKEEEVVSARILPCQGMRNVFILRFDADGSDIPDDECHAFPSRYEAYSRKLDICYSEDIARFLNKLYRELAAIIGRTAERAQGIQSKKRVSFYIDKSCWFYLLNRLHFDWCVPLKKRIIPLHKRIKLPGLTIRRPREMRECDVIRTETVDDVITLCGLLGESALVDARVRPNGDEERHLVTNDAVNVITGQADREAPFMQRTVREGVDFCFDSDRGMLYLYVRYGMYVFKDDGPHNSSLSEALINMDPPVGLLENEDEEAEETLEGGNGGNNNDNQFRLLENVSEFSHNGDLYTVIHVTNESVSARCFYPASSPHYETIVPFNDVNYVLGRVRDSLSH